MPAEFPVNARYEVFGSMIPAAQVGGDLFDFFPLDEDGLGFVIGDVAGKGIPAAFFMAVCRTVLRMAAAKGSEPHECIEDVNRYLL